MFIRRRELNEIFLMWGEALQEVLKLHKTLQEQRLEYARSTRDLIEQFFIAQEAGIDVREQLEAGLRDMQDEVARLEEHAA